MRTNDHPAETAADGRLSYCLHEPHPDPAIEGKAREIYMARNGWQGETPECWWNWAQEALS